MESNENTETGMIYFLIAFATFFSTADALYSTQCHPNKTKLLSQCSFALEKYSKIGVLHESSGFRYLRLWGRFTSFTSVASKSVNFYSPGRIYEFNELDRKLLVPVPFLITCPGHRGPIILSSCEFLFGDFKLSNSESISSLIPMNNFTYVGASSALFLEEGSTTVKNCKVLDCQENVLYTTDPNDKFTFVVEFEKPVGTQCRTIEQCGSDTLYRCDVKRGCQCRDSVETFRNVYGTFCNDSLEMPLYCHENPHNCLIWCNFTDNSECICPTGSLKVQRNRGYVCELKENEYCGKILNVPNNAFRCTAGTSCIGGYCRAIKKPKSVIAQIATKVMNSGENSVAVIKVFLVILSVVLFVVLFTLIVAVCKLKTMQNKSFNKPNIFMPVDSSSMSSKVLRSDNHSIISSQSEALRNQLEVRNFVSPHSTLNGHISNNWSAHHNPMIAIDSNNRCMSRCPSSRSASKFESITNSNLINLSPNKYFNRSQVTDDGYATDDIIHHKHCCTKDSAFRPRSPSPCVRRLSNGDIVISA